MSKIYDAMKRAEGEKDRLPAPAREAAPNEGPRDVPSMEEHNRLIQGIVASAGDLQVVLIISSVRGEGASTVARNVSKMLSTHGSTLLIDANLRAPSQHEAFGVDRSPGFRDVARRSADPGQVVRNGFTPGLSLMTSGEPEGGPPRLSSEALMGVMDELRSRFDWIVIDGPPVTIYSEAAFLAGLADCAVLVVQADRTRWEVAEQAKRILSERGVRILGAVLNRRKFHIPESVYKHL
jgi:capsular exopolysaccharide synthesis family protein